MSATTAIEWTDRTWNPVTGCTKVSPGCDNCYAEGIATRFAGTKAFPAGFDVVMHPERIEQPLRWRKPSRVFVNSMSDLFHDDVPDLFLTRVFDVMEQATAHTFQVLTKRHGRMRAFLRDRAARREDYARQFEENPIPERRTCPAAAHARHRADNPPPNIWIGVSVEDQKRADLRIPALLDTPAAVRFLSCEPLLGPVDLAPYLSGDCPGCGRDVTTEVCGTSAAAAHHGMAVDAASISWVIVGGESGPGARPMHPDWARGLRDQCTAAGVPFFFKQRGEWTWRHPGWQPQDWATNPARNGYVLPTGEHGAQVTAAHLEPDVALVYRVGTKAAGRELDGRTWDEFPEVAR